MSRIPKYSRRRIKKRHLQSQMVNVSVNKVELINLHGSIDNIVDDSTLIKVIDSVSFVNSSNNAENIENSTIIVNCSLNGSININGSVCWYKYFTFIYNHTPKNKMPTRHYFNISTVDIINFFKIRNTHYNYPPFYNILGRALLEVTLTLKIL